MTRRRHMPAGSGGVRCLECGATAAADGKGTPIILHHDEDCSEHPRNLSNARWGEAGFEGTPWRPDGLGPSAP